MKHLVLNTVLEGEVDTIELVGSQFHHIVRVRRGEVGQSIAVIDANGQPFVAEIDSIRHGSCTLKIVGRRERPIDKQAVSIALFVGYLRGGLLDTVVRQATELGVARFVPVETERSVGTLHRASGRRVSEKLDRWRKISREAMEQSGRQTPMEISAPVDIARVPSECPPGAMRVLPHPSRLERRRIVDILPGEVSDVALCIGPEGGFSDAEVNHLTKHGFEIATLADHILRADTAVVFAVAAVQSVVRGR